MEKEKQAERFLKHINDNYDRLKGNNQRYADAKLGGFDEDVYSNTILKIYDKILKDGIDDDTPEGYENYLFKSFQINSKREKQYARNKKNDDNVEQDLLLGVYENWYERNNISSKEKLISDLRKDYFALYIMLKVEEQFDTETFYAFRLKTILGLTYKQLAEKTKIPSVRNKVLAVYDWLKNNVTMEEVEKAFQEKFRDLIDF